MIDTKELRRLAQAALAAPDGLSAEWMDRLGQFQEAADASVVSELLDRLEAAESECLEQARLNGMGASREAALMAKLEAAEKERDGLRHCFNEWIDKTEWVQRGVNEGTISPKYLGLHRADIIASLLGAAEKERDALRAKIEQMERQKPAGTVQWINGWPVVDAYAGVVLEPDKPLYALPGAKGE